LKKIAPGLVLKERISTFMTYILLLCFLTLFLLPDNLAYTQVNAIFALTILLVVKFFDPSLLPSYYLTFLFILIPFFIVNGILTGSGITEEIVWYNDSENLGLRLGTIPIEDMIYAFSLILLNLTTFRMLSRKFQ
jgi:lycopene cyclase domain-containing protein